MENIFCPHCGLVGDFMIKKTDFNISYVCFGCEKSFNVIQKDIVPKMPFGKYKKTPIAEITNLKYLLWVQKNIDIKTTLRFFIEEQIKHLENEKTINR